MTWNWRNRGTAGGGGTPEARSLSPAFLAGSNPSSNPTNRPTNAASSAKRSPPRPTSESSSSPSKIVMKQSPHGPSAVAHSPPRSSLPHEPAPDGQPPQGFTSAEWSPWPPTVVVSQPQPQCWLATTCPAQRHHRMFEPESADATPKNTIKTILSPRVAIRLSPNRLTLQRSGFNTIPSRPTVFHRKVLGTALLLLTASVLPLRPASGARRHHRPAMKRLLRVRGA